MGGRGWNGMRGRDGGRKGVDESEVLVLVLVEVEEGG